MRFFPTALIMGLLVAMPASAQNENVTVTGQETLSGFWKINFRATASGPNDGVFCRIAQTRTSLSSRCLPVNGKGTGSVDGNNIHLAWPAYIRNASDGWSMDIPGAWLVMDGTLRSSSSFDGTSAAKLLGLRVFVPKDLDKLVPSAGKKLIMSSTDPDAAGLAILLSDTLQELANGAIVRPHDAAIATNLWGEALNKPEEIRALGKTEAVIYLGEASRRRSTPKEELSPFVFSVYQVEFTNGQRLCGIHQRDDGVFDGFLCV